MHVLVFGPPAEFMYGNIRNLILITLSNIILWQVEVI